MTQWLRQARAVAVGVIPVTGLVVCAAQLAAGNDRPWCVASARIEADYRSRELTGQSLPARGHGPRARFRSPLTRNDAKETRPASFPSAFVDVDCRHLPDVAGHRTKLYTGARCEAASRSVRSHRQCPNATVCHMAGRQSPHCECLKVKTRPLELIRKDETRNRTAPLLFFNIASGGEFKHGEPRHQRTRL